MMDERRISEAEFDAAVDQIMKKMIDEPKLEGMARLLVSMTGHMFTSEMKEILFPKENKEDAE